MKSTTALSHFLLGTAFLATASSLHAQAPTQYQWNGTTDALFATTTNWTGGLLAPTAGTTNSRLNVNNTNSARPLTWTASVVYSGNNAGSRALVIGSGTSGSMVITGGTFDSRQADNDIMVNGGFAGFLTINGGDYINTNGGSNTFLLGFNGAVGAQATLNMQSGNFTTGILQFGQTAGLAGTLVSIANLDGGILTANEIRESGVAGTNVALMASTINFNGGTLRAGATNASFLSTGSVDNAVVQGLGAVIDTNTFNVTIGKALTAGTGSGGLTKQGVGTLTLSGTNTYTGDTTVTAGTLTLAVGGTQRFVIGASGINNKITGNASGTLNLNGKLLLNLTAAGTTTGNSWNVVDVANFVAVNPGTLTVESTLGAFTSSGGNWTKIENGVTYQFSQTSGILSVIPGGANAYDTWAAQITNGLNLRADDADGDGFNNLQEFLYGTSPIAGNGALVSTTTSGGNLVLRWLQRETGATYTLKESTTLDTGSWSTVVSPVPALDGDQTGALTDYDYFTVSIPLGSSKAFFRIEGVEN